MQEIEELINVLDLMKERYSRVMDEGERQLLLRVWRQWDEIYWWCSQQERKGEEQT